MKIVIDARLYGLEHAGLGRYVINLINQIEKLDTKNDFYLLLRKKYFKTLKFKNKKFAENCDREIISECELAGIDTDRFLEISLEAMQEIAGELGL